MYPQGTRGATKWRRSGALCTLADPATSGVVQQCACDGVRSACFEYRYQVRDELAATCMCGGACFEYRYRYSICRTVQHCFEYRYRPRSSSLQWTRRPATATIASLFSPSKMVAPPHAILYAALRITSFEYRSFVSPTSAARRP